MTTGNDRLRGSGLLLLLGGIAFLGTAFPAACNHGGGLAPTDAGASGGANGGAPADGPGTGGADAQVSDGPPADVPVDAAGGNSAVAGAGGLATGGSGGGAGGKLGGGGSGEGGKRGGGGTAGGDVVDAGAPDLPSGTGGMAQGGAAGGAPGDASVGGNGGATDGGTPDVMFPCGPCPTHWVCGGAGDAGYTDVILTVEDDGCYLSGLPGHKLLAPDGTITEAGSPVARAQKFGPQVGLYYPDGSQWLYCGGNLPCNP